MVDQTNKPDLWSLRDVEETQQIYADWADTYEADLVAKNYATPDRIAAALAGVSPQMQGPLLDFGCGTGMAGVALATAGFTTIDGTDITPEMLDRARTKDVYRKLWIGTAGVLDFEADIYDYIVACGVVSLGAAPPEALGTLLFKLGKGGLLAFSYNDPTLADNTYVSELNAHLELGHAEVVFREHGPHLNDIVTGSDVIILRRL